MLCSEHRSRFCGSPADILGRSSTLSSAPSPGPATCSGWSPCSAGARTLGQDATVMINKEELAGLKVLKRELREVLQVAAST